MKVMNRALASFINRGSCARVWNYHARRILFIIWPFSIGIYRLQSGHYLNRKLIVVTDSWRYMFAPKCYVTCGHTIFITWRYPLNNSDIIWAMLCENVSYAICEQQNSRSADIPAQSDQRLCCSLLRKKDILYTCFVQRFRILACLCSWAYWFESNLIANRWRHIFAWCGSYYKFHMRMTTSVWFVFCFTALQQFR